MKTPYGQECKFFYGDYFRGRNHEECRLLSPEQNLSQWSNKYCKTCPVPAILQANSCPTMVLEGKIFKGFFGLTKSIKVSAYCTQSKTNVQEPHIGCGSCHPIPELYIKD